MKEYYIVLPSNVISEEFPNNKTNNYSTSLPSNLELGGNGWEVCLSEITYPHSWYNIDVNCFIEIINVVSSTLQGKEVINRSRDRAVVPPGYYNDGYEIIDILNDLLRFRGKSSRFNYNASNNIISVSIVGGEHIKLNTDFAAILGFGSRRFFDWINKESAIVSASNGLDLNLKTHNIFIYSDIVRYTLVGNTYAPLLRMVPTYNENRSKYVTEQFVNRYYHSLNSSYIKQISISILDDQGDPIKFRSGKVSVVLHFRKVNI